MMTDPVPEVDEDRYRVSSRAARCRELIAETERLLTAGRTRHGTAETTTVGTPLSASSAWQAWERHRRRLEAEQGA